MKFLPLVFFVLTLRCEAQHFSFGVTFTKMYLGEYDPSGKRSTLLTLAPNIRAVNVDYDGNASLVAIFDGKFSTDTLSLQIDVQSETPGDDFVEYKCLSEDGYLIFLRYNRYGVPGIREMSIFERKRDKFFYIKNRIFNNVQKQ